ncbi:MAG TPA: GAF domain-containing protein [Dongiaceae bacterium]|nr:GAF domain-containing protein [Dongiaceae bacterium]
MREPITYIIPVRICGAVSAGIGCAALAGWLLELPGLASLGRELIPMAPSTALLFVAYGVALLLACRATGGRRTTQFILFIFALGAIISGSLLFLSMRGVLLDIEHLGIEAIGAVAGSPVGHMSPIAAVTFLLFSMLFPVVLTSGIKRPLLTKGVWWIAVIVGAAYSMLILAYLFGTPMFYGGAFIPPAANTTLAFMALAIALLALSQPLAWQETEPHGQEAPDSSPVLIVLFIFLVAGIISAGNFYHRNHQKEYLSGVERQLSAISDLKVGELLLWREERLADAGIFYHNADFASSVKAFLQQGKGGQARQRIESWIGNIQKNHNYNRIFLLDPQGKTVLSMPQISAEPLSDSLRQKAIKSLRTGQITFTDFYRNEFGGKIFLGILAPIFDQAREGAALGVLMIRIDPEEYLYPFIKRWPNSSTTAETLLVRREGNEAVFLNELRFGRNAALNLKLPLEETKNPVVMAALGKEGVVRGIDYRGRPVLAALRSIPDSPWHLVARMDEEEIYAPMQERLWITVVLISTMLLCAGTGFGFIWRQRSASYYKRSEQQTRRNKERLQYLLNIFQFESNDVKELLDYALNEALRMTSSTYGYIYYYDEATRQFVLNSWSRDVMQACSVVSPHSLYDLGKAGIWGEAIRQRRPIMVNDFDAPDPLKKGYPEGHVPLTRFLTIPHIDHGKIVAVVGVANKETAYDDADILQLTLLMGSVWKMAERKEKEREIEKKNAELERFTYTVSHDLKSPLVTIKTFLGYLEDDIKLPDNPRVKQDLGFMHNAADKMSQLLDELLELSRVGRTGNPPQSVAFIDMANESVRLNAGRISERGVSVEIIDSPVILFGDRSRLVEIWLNLVENAVKYGGDEPALHVEIGCAMEDDGPVFFVRDNGIGIDPRYHKNIFNLFDKLDSGSEGTGLGLALVKRIVEIYGGRIWVESEGVGHGSCFRFILPEAIQR